MRSEPADLAWRQQVAAVAEDHVRSAHEESITSADAAAVEQWLSVRVPFAVHMPMIPDAVLKGARLCYLDGHRGAVLRYQVEGDEVSFYVMPIGSNAPPPAPEQFLRGVERGYQIVAWQHAALIHALVGNVPEVRLLQMARYCVDRLGATGNQPAERVAPLAARLP
jgi:anti-sigma factor RsiW